MAHLRYKYWEGMERDQRDRERVWRLEAELAAIPRGTRVVC